MTSVKADSYYLLPAVKMSPSTQLLSTKAVNSLFSNPRIIKLQVCLQGVSVRCLGWSLLPPARLPAVLWLLATKAGAETPSLQPEHVKQAVGVATCCWLRPGKQGPFSPLSVSRLATFPFFSESGNLLPKSDRKTGSVFIVRRSQQFLHEATGLGDFFQVDCKQNLLSGIWGFSFV